jgi:hypothetical protein
MKFRIFTVALAFVMVFCLVSCDKSSEEEEKSASDSGGNSASGSGTNEVTTSDVNSRVVSENGKFDIETVRKNIYYKDNRFEIPTTLGELKTLDEKWGYSNLKYGDEYGDDNNIGIGYCDVTYDGEFVFNGVIENCYDKKEKDAIIYGINCENSEVSFDGISVSKTTGSEVLAKYGTPVWEAEPVPDKFDYFVYSFGIRKFTGLSEKELSHGITVTFPTDTNIAKSIVFYYQADFKGE